MFYPKLLVVLFFIALYFSLVNTFSANLQTIIRQRSPIFGLSLQF